MVFLIYQQGVDLEQCANVETEPSFPFKISNRCRVLLEPNWIIYSALPMKSSDPVATLNPTALVHEAWMKLAASPHFHSASPLHFKRIAARAMRQLLVESARRRNSQKRGGDGNAILVVFDETVDIPASREDGILRIEAALQELERVNPRQALMVESRFFGGLEVSETAELLEVSEATILRDWRVVKAWLARELSAGV